MAEIFRIMFRDFFKKLNQMRSGWSCPDIVRLVRAESLTYLDPGALCDLFEVVRDLEDRNLEGVLIEAGCAYGGSAMVMATAKSKDREFYVFDTFGMIPPPTLDDGGDVHQRYEEIKSGKSKGIDGKPYYGYEDNLLQKVIETFEKHGLSPEQNRIHFVKGLFQDTMKIDEPVALAHLDGDWYESVMTCLRAITPNLVRGGVLVIDDYDAWSGCRKAVDEYFNDKRTDFEFRHKSRLHVIKR